MAPPTVRHHIYADQIIEVCDVDRTRMMIDIAHGRLRAGDLQSLVIYAGHELADEYRKALQLDLARPYTEAGPLPPHCRSPAVIGDAPPWARPVWEVSAEKLELQLGIRRNTAYRYRGQGRFDYGSILELIRFAAFAAETGIRGELSAAVFGRPHPVVWDEGSG